MKVSSQSLKNDSINLLLKKFTIPAIVSMLISAIYNIVDQIYLGNLIGPNANAATTVAFPVIITIISFSVLFGVGCGIYISTKLGEENHEKAQKAYHTIFLIVTIVAIIITLLGIIHIDNLIILFGAKPEIYGFSKIYTSIILLGTWSNMMIIFLDKVLRSDSAPSFSMFVTILGAVINIILDPILITKIGISGAAIATVVSQYISAFSMLFYLHKRGNFTLNFSKMFKLSNENLAILKKCMYFGSSSFIIQVGSILMQTVANRALVKYGDLDPNVGGVIALAAVGVVLKISMIIVSICVGIGIGCQPIISFNNGAKQYKRVKEVYKKSLFITFLITLVLWFIIQLTPSTIINIFDSSDGVFHTFGMRALRFYHAAFFLVGIDIVTIIFFQSLGKPLLSASLSFIRQVVIIVPLIIILPNFLGLDGILISSPIAELIVFVLIMFVIKKVMTNLENE